MLPQRFPISSQVVQKSLKDTPEPLPTFYVCPYADPAPQKSSNYSLVYYPEPKYNCDINLAFITPSEDKAAGTFGNTVSDQYLRHLRDRSAVRDFVASMQGLNRRILVSYIDSPNIHWNEVAIENFVRNTEGEITADGGVFTNDLMMHYKPLGRMWDAETPEAEAMAEVMKACFLRGIQRDPEHYVFVYTTYADRDIDSIILPMRLDPKKSPVDKALYDLGFRQVSDFITMRGNLSWLETMSYGGEANARFEEADNYAVKYLAKGDASKLHEMRKFISIGVAPELTSLKNALTIAAACNPKKEEGYGRFMVWAANCPEGLSLFHSMMEARSQELLFKEECPVIKQVAKEVGNRSRFFALLEPDSKKTQRGLIDRLTCGVFERCFK